MTPRARRGLQALLLGLSGWGPLLLIGCEQQYRVGEYVWVEWNDHDKRQYPAYVVELKGSRLRVHYEGYDVRWDEDVTPDRIKGRISGPVTSPPPPPEKVARSLGLWGVGAASASASSSAAAAPGGFNPFKVGDRVRVRWRGSVYGAQVIEVLGVDRLRVHYDGHEAAWDEVVDIERIQGRR